MTSHSSDSGSYTKGFIAGAIIGGAAGAIVALLFAPKSGIELRRDIAEKSTEIYDKASDYLYSVESQIGTAVNTTVNEGRTKAQNIIDSARRQAEDLIANAESILHDARTKAASAKDTVQEKINDLRDAAKASAEVFRKEMKNEHKELTDEA